MGYYYLLSSLPMLRSDGDLPMTYDEFLEICHSSLSGSKYELLRNLSLSSSEGPLVSEWAKFYNTLNDELIHQRNQRLGREGQAAHQKDESASKIVTAAMNAKNPLAAEEMLLALQFEKLDQLIDVHYFDDYALFGYALKLKLLERKSSFKKESGKAEFSRIVGELEEQIMSMEQE